MAEINSEVELVSCVDGEEWFSNAPGKKETSRIFGENFVSISNKKAFQ